MRGFELKRIVKILWKNPTAPEEKTPIVKKRNKLTENGTIPMDESYSADDIFRSTNEKRYLDNIIESRKEETPESMSLLRKLCFFLSLNAGVIYVLILGWWLPCRHQPCTVSEDSWSSNFNNIKLITNIETYPRNNPTLVIFGYSNQDGGNLGALRISDGKQTWNTTLQSIPRHVFCAASNYPNCFVTAYNYIAAFDALNGTVIWERNLMSDQTISKISLTRPIGNNTYLFGIADEFMYVMDTQNGTEISKISLPCSWTIDVKIAGPWFPKTGSLWALVCEYGDSMEVWTFKEKELLNFSNNANELKSLSEGKFKRLFSKQSYGGSIDLAGDVTANPHSLVLSWADMVVMVTAQAPFHHLRKTWDRSFSSPLGYAIGITGSTTSHFVSSKSMQIAVAVQEGIYSTVHILDAKNGSSLVETGLGAGTVLSIKNMSGPNGETDFLIVEWIKGTNSSHVLSDKSDSDIRTYFTMHYKDSKVVFKNIVEAEYIYASNLSPISKGSANLILASSPTDGDSVISRLVIKQQSPEKSICRYEEKKSNSTLMFIE